MRRPLKAVQVSAGRQFEQDVFWTITISCEARREQVTLTEAGGGPQQTWLVMESGRGRGRPAAGDVLAARLRKRARV